MMSVYLVCLILLVSAMAFLKIYWARPYFISGFMGIYYTLFVFLTIAAFATGMELCWKRVAATQFTLYMAISNLGRATGSGLLGTLHAVLPWEYVILSFAGFATVMLIFIQLLHPGRHFKAIDQLESDHTEKRKTTILPAVLNLSSDISPKQ
jgi:MFS transporter, PAT family, beta-lactamase induction signal transducer AmpG